MACCPKSIIAEILKAKGAIKSVYFVACGGSYAGLHPGKYFLESESKELKVDHYSSNEFCHATPKSLGENSIVITQSSSGNTPETVKAAEIAQKAGAASIVITNKPESPLAQNGDYVLVPEKGSTANSGQAYSLKLAVEILNQTEGYENYDEMQNGFDRIDKIVGNATQFIAPRAEKWAKMYKDEKLIYTMGSGSAYSVAYSFAICLLMEMQWINSGCIHSGEYFHGPFEVTDYDVPFMLVKSIGHTRHLDERVENFAKKFTEDLLVLDQKDLDLSTVADEAKPYVAAILTGVVIRHFVEAIAFERGHSLDVRRYMWQMQY